MPTLATALASLDGKESLSAEDTLVMRQIVFDGDCAVSSEEADALFQITRGSRDISVEWRNFFFEALTDYIVHQQSPAGYIDQAKADWIMGKIKIEGASALEAELIVHILEAADEAPLGLSSYMLGVLKASLLDRVASRAISKADVELLRRAVFALGGDGNIQVTRNEADFLFDLNDALHDAPNDPSWADLFTRAVADSVLCVQTYTELSAAEELNGEAFLADTRVHPREFLGALLHPSQTIHDFKQKDPDILQMWAARDAADADAQQKARSVTEKEARWLMERIERDGKFDDNERKLVKFLVENASQIHPVLHPAIAALHLPTVPLATTQTPERDCGPPAEVEAHKTPAEPVFGHRIRSPS